MIVWLAIASELAGLLISLLLMRRQAKVSFGPSALPFGLVLLLCAVMAIFVLSFQGLTGPMLVPVLTVVAIFGTLFAALALMTDLQVYIRKPKADLKQT